MPAPRKESNKFPIAHSHHEQAFGMNAGIIEGQRWVALQGRLTVSKNVHPECPPSSTYPYTITPLYSLLPILY